MEISIYSEKKEQKNQVWLFKIPEKMVFIKHYGTFIAIDLQQKYAAEQTETKNIKILPTNKRLLPKMYKNRPPLQTNNSSLSFLERTDWILQLK